MIDTPNPFALARASEFTDRQINSLWVELGPATISAVIEPRSKISKFILGGKGSGKTHLLRYYSYTAARLRFKNDSGLEVVAKHNFLAIFIRATGLDAARFEATGEYGHRWQHLFGVYLELRLVEGVLDALIDVAETSPNETFDDVAFIDEVGRGLVGADLAKCNTLKELRKWILEEKRSIDDAVNNAAFSGTLDVRIPFSIGSFCIPVSRAMARWNVRLVDIPLLYLIDEIENFSASQQQVVNTLIRYGEGLATFRVTGRLYAKKTLATLADGEENREGAEFKTENLDEKLRSYSKYPDFAKKFVRKRLIEAGLLADIKDGFSPSRCFEDIGTEDLYANVIRTLGLDSSSPPFVKSFVEVLRPIARERNSESEADRIVETLIGGLPLLLQKLNLLLFAKKIRTNSDLLSLSAEIRSTAVQFLSAPKSNKGAYATAYGHYASDLFAQLCRESRKSLDVPYAGFEAFVRMSSCNPRNLLILLGRAYEIAKFRDVDFVHGSPLNIPLQTEAAVASARFAFESDTNYGTQSDQAREAVRRLAEVLHVARFSLKIPEVSPLAVSFSDGDLTIEARGVLNNALNYSLLYEIYSGRRDRNTQQLNRKVQLNPMLSPRWGLATSRGGDLKLNKDLINAIFLPSELPKFEALLKGLRAKWNSLLREKVPKDRQPRLFE